MPVGISRYDLNNIGTLRWLLPGDCHVAALLAMTGGRTIFRFPVIPRPVRKPVVGIPVGVLPPALVRGNEVTAAGGEVKGAE